MKTQTKTTYSEKVNIECNKKVVSAFVDKYEPGKYLAVIIEGVRVSLNHQKNGSFVGRFAGMELVCEEPPIVLARYTTRGY